MKKQAKHTIRIDVTVYDNNVGMITFKASNGTEITSPTIGEMGDNENTLLAFVGHYLKAEESYAYIEQIDFAFDELIEYFGLTEWDLNKDHSENELDYLVHVPMEVFMKKFTEKFLCGEPQPPRAIADEIEPVCICQDGNVYNNLCCTVHNPKETDEVG